MTDVERDRPEYEKGVSDGFQEGLKLAAETCHSGDIFEEGADVSPLNGLERATLRIAAEKILKLKFGG